MKAGAGKANNTQTAILDQTCIQHIPIFGETPIPIKNGSDALSIYVVLINSVAKNFGSYAILAHMPFFSVLCATLLLDLKMILKKHLKTSNSSYNVA